jgi:hypothetical protein
MSSYLETNFPSDLWTRIRPYLPQNDLANLCRTSSTLLGAVRGLLYRQVHINCNHTATIDLLLSDKDLADSVLDFAFKSSEKGGNTSEMMNKVYEAALAMASLRKLHLCFQDIAMFEDTEVQRRFLDKFNNRTNPLETLEVSGSGLSSSESVLGNFTLSRLTNLSWTCEWNVSHPYRKLMKRIADESTDTAYLFDILKASADTLKSISITFNHVSGYELPAEPIWKMNFPQIRSLSLKHWEGDEGPGATIGFWKFLTLHPSLESLEITPNDFDSVPTAPDPDMEKDLPRPFLPNLRTFKGEGKVFLQLINMQPACLSTTLRCLELFTGSQNPVKVKSLLDSALLQSDGESVLLPSLKMFTLWIWDFGFGDESSDDEESEGEEEDEEEEDGPSLVQVVVFYLDKLAKESKLKRFTLTVDGAPLVRCKIERDESGGISMQVV